ncbi:DUF502 domain-containing protein [Thiohalocapsa sp. ML1]|jgi:uncharacterized membrane protein|uniref:DUF502 domain-containing protein n=1 Tax=Thiohalocapsa sp. ML1 TaxID=1431688 RepID=UPI00073206D4|nr:DUF502 domain-containing protein [Thiohalocapsa sp. ML1]
MSKRSVMAALTRLRNLFLQGIALLAPLTLTIALLVWLGHSVEALVGGALAGLLPQGWYVPGMGLAVGVLLTLAAGLLANIFLVRWVLNLLERVLDRIPLVKSLFQGLKDVARFLEQGADKQFGRPVTVALPLGDGGGKIELVGFMMQEPAALPRAGVGDATDADGRVAVYLPMSYQVGGYTLYLDSALVQSLDVRSDDALRAVLTGGALGRGRRPSRGRGPAVPAADASTAAAGHDGAARRR